jgi:hypothetical protein
MYYWLLFKSPLHSIEYYRSPSFNTKSKAKAWMRYCLSMFRDVAYSLPNLNGSMQANLMFVYNGDPIRIVESQVLALRGSLLVKGKGA